MRSKSRKFAEKMAAFVGGAYILSTTLRRFNSFPSVVFTDEAYLPSSTSKYWLNYLVPHIFFCRYRDTDSARLGGLPRAPFAWPVRTVDVPHNSVGGATTAIWTLVAWYPPDHRVCTPLPLPTLPWSPLHCFLNDRVSATMAPAPVGCPIPAPQVLMQGGFVMSHGLFPSSNRTTVVHMQCSTSPTNWGTRSLELPELGGLWDMPILFMDALSASDDADVYHGILGSAPGKVLHLGTDFLLTACFRGGDEVDKPPETPPTSRKRTFEMIPPSPTHAPSPPHISPADIATDTAKFWLPLQFANFDASDSDSDDDDEEGDTLLVIKQDSQKADWAPVPDHLWLQSFKQGYQSSEQTSRHFDALATMGVEVEQSRRVLPRTKPPSAIKHQRTYAARFGKTCLNKFCTKYPRSAGGGYGWKAAMKGFRELGLRWWRRSLIRGFKTWREKHLPQIQHQLPRPYQLVETEYITKTGVVEMRYVWRGGERGRLRYTSQLRTLRSCQEGKASFEVGYDGIRRAAESSWFEWLEGSAPFFWNWPEKYQKGIRDGQPHFMTGEFGVFLRAQKKQRDAAKHEKMRAKIVQVRKRGYVSPGHVVSLTHYFCVDKGEDDIRMVYNGTSCGLNSVLWAPHFGLPTVRHTLRSLLPGYYQCDLDIGEMFLNFMLHEFLRQYSGVDIKNVRSLDSEDAAWEAEHQDEWERWVRNWMGLTDSPYRSLQWMIRLKMEAYGDRRQRSNPFHWEKVVLNLPGSRGYRSDMPWVMKLRWDGHLASEVYIYVDDGRPTAHSAELCWQVARALASLCTRYGTQDAARKRTPPSLTTGPWAGTVTHTDNGELVGMVSQKKWDKTKSLIRELAQMIEKGSLPLQRLLEIRGFLNYVVRTYKWLNPYIKGLHLTIDGWRPGKDEEGYKLRGKALQEAMFTAAAARGLPCRRENDADDEGDSTEEEVKAPEFVDPSPRLERDAKCLLELTDVAEPPRQRYRAKKTKAFFVVGDASGKAKGCAVVEQYGIDYEAGSWNLEWREKSSNCREAENLTDKVERMSAKGELEGHEVFVITDNSSFEGAYYKGHSPSRELNGIIFRLHKAERNGRFILHVIHISGKRMKATGVDGLSRGDLMEGMMAGEDPMSFLPFDEGADERSRGKVSAWVKSWWQDEREADWGNYPLVEVTKDNMFELKDVDGARLWMPPPAAMETVMEMFNEDRLAHPTAPHVFVVPRLMTYLWRKDLGKDADVLFTVQTGVPFWTSNQFEPLLVAIVFPLSHVPRYAGPWLVRGTDEGREYERTLTLGFKIGGDYDAAKLHDVDGSVRSLWEDPQVRSRIVLQQLLAWARTLPPVSECMVRRVLPGVSGRPLSKATGERRRRRKRLSVGEERHGEVPARKKRRSPDGDPV